METLKKDTLRSLVEPGLWQDKPYLRRPWMPVFTSFQVLHKDDLKILQEKYNLVEESHMKFKGAESGN